MNVGRGEPPADSRNPAPADLLRGLSDGERQRVLAAGRRRTIDRGGFLFLEARPAAAMFLVVRGEIKVTQAAPDGREVLLRIVGPGEMLAAAALLEAASYPATAQAMTDAEVLAWSGPALASLMESIPGLALAALRLMVGRVHEMQERFRELATERVERRVAGALVRLVGRSGRRTAEGVLIEPALSREEIASMTGTTLFTVSRLLTGWAKRGILKCGRRKILILKPHELVSLAEDL